MSLTVQVSNNEVTVSQNAASSITVSQEATPTLTVSAAGLVGPVGATGAQGVAGAQGSTGAQGAQGVTGSQGAQGASGASTFPYSGSARITGSLGVTGSIHVTNTPGSALHGISDAGIQVSRLSTAFGFPGETWGGYLYPLLPTTLFNRDGSFVGGTKKPLALQPLGSAQDVALATVNHGANIFISASNQVFIGYGGASPSTTHIRDLLFVEGILSGSTTYISGSLTATGGVTASLLGTAATASYIDPVFISASVAASGFGTTVSTGSLLTTGSVSSNTLTFTKGDGSTFSLTVATGSGAAASTFPYSGTAQITGSLEIFNTTSNAITTTSDGGIKVVRHQSAFGFPNTAWGGYLYPLVATTIRDQAGVQLGGTKNPLTLQPLGTAQDVALSTVNHGAAVFVSASNEIYLGFGSSSPSKTFIRDAVTINGSLRGTVNSLTIASSTASLSMSGSNFYTLQLVPGANTHINPIHILPGQTVSLQVNTTGSGTVSFPPAVKQPSGSNYTPTTSTGVDVLTLITFDSSNVYLANVKNLI